MRPGFFLKEHSVEARTSRDAGSGCLVGIGLQPRDQFVQVLRRYSVPCKKNNWSRDQRRDGFEIIQQVVWQRIESAEFSQTRRQIIGGWVPTRPPFSPGRLSMPTMCWRIARTPGGSWKLAVLPRRRWCRGMSLG